MPVRDLSGAIVEWVGTSTDADDLVRAREALARSGAELEALVAARTAELAQALDTLHQEVLERQEAEARLRQGEKLRAIGQLTGGIAHDFNNMLQGITSSIDMARRRVEQGEPIGAARFLDLAGNSAARAATLVKRLLAFARKQELAPRLVNPSRLAQGMEELIRRTVGGMTQVQFALCDGAWLLLCDPSQLESALLNLCVNARDAMPQGGRLTIATEEVELSAPAVPLHDDAAPGRYAVLSVTDTGTGMPPEVAARAFEPFFTTKPFGQGTGLGLSQIYGFVRQSGGFVKLESQSGAGTTVRLFLPFHAIEPDVPSPTLPQSARTVLLVEDEETVRAITAEHLRDQGYGVLEAEDGPTALRLLTAAPSVHIVVSDYALPGGMTGAEVIEAARKLVPGLPALLMTGYAAGASLSGLDVLRKPFVPEALLRRVAASLALEPAGD